MDTEKTKPSYLGDGVYVHLTNEVTADHNQGICLTTGNHDPAFADNIIYLEPEQIQKLQEYLKNPQVW